MSEAVYEAAGAWFARRRSGAMTPAEAAALEAWLAEPAHRAAFEAVERGWAGAEEFRRAPEILALRERARGRRAGVTRAVAGRALAAGLALAVVGAAGWGLKASGLIDLRRFSSQSYATRVGERTAVTLPDGSVVTLNTDTRLRTAPDRERRVVYLDRGQAYFRVAKDAEHPFVVHAAGRTITALGTAFDVRVDRGKLAVVLVEGKVRVEAPAAAPPPRPGVRSVASPPAVRRTEMLPGDQLVSADTAQWTLARTDAARETSWLVGRLKFEGRPLGDIAGEFNRYSERKIVIADSALAARPVSGSFRADDQDAFVEALEIAGIAQVEAETDTAVTLERP